jgi:hypothetical protein
MFKRTEIHDNALLLATCRSQVIVLNTGLQKASDIFGCIRIPSQFTFPELSETDVYLWAGSNQYSHKPDVRVRFIKSVAALCGVTRKIKFQ